MRIIAVVDDCPTCKQKIRGTKHTLVQRPNHFRIYKDQAQRTSVERRSYYGHVDGMLLADFAVKVDQEREKECSGSGQRALTRTGRQTAADHIHS
jgi:hypothetical protein